MKMRIEKRKKIVEYEDEIVLPTPRVRYTPYIEMKDKKVYMGATVPIPYVLFFYLTSLELKVISIIMYQTRTTGSCIMRVKTIADILGFTATSVQTVINRMVKMNIISNEAIGRRRNKVINFSAVQKLNEITKGMKPGAISGLRHVMKDRNINNIPEVTGMYWKDKYSYKDEIEEEEYV